jgi:hypothetical protein
VRCLLLRRAQVKNSATRNLHRLAAAILFVKLLFHKLLQHKEAAAEQQQQQQQQGAAAAAAVVVTLREAASAAYEEALAPIHTVIVKVGVAGLRLVWLSWVAACLRASCTAVDPCSPHRTCDSVWCCTQGVVRAGMLTLPSREHFIHSIGACRV